MKVIFLAGGIDANLNARINPLASILRKYSIKSEIIKPLNWRKIIKGKIGGLLSIMLTHSLNAYMRVLEEPPDIIIISRLSTPQIYILQCILKNKKVKIIFDLDDALFLPTTNIFCIKIRPGSFCLEKVIHNANFITVNGHFLLRYAKTYNENVSIIYDPIDTDLFRPVSKKPSKETVIGWEGNATVHLENLSIIIKPLEKLAKKYDFKFKIVSSLGDPRVKQLFRQLEKYIEIDYGPPHWLPINKFAKLLTDLDIMVAPLRRTLWNEGKSALRVGIGMSMGTPVVASPVGEQKYIIRHGVNGFLARNEDEWIHYLELLIEDGKLRREMGRRGRKTAEEKLSLQVIGRKLYNVLTKVLS